MSERPLLTIVKPGVGPAPVPPADPGLPAESADAPRLAAPPGNRFFDALGRVVVVVIVVAVSAVALAPGLVKGDLPIDAALLGTPARGVVRADRDYALIDEVATEGLKRVAIERSRPVWDLDDERARRDAQVLQKALLRVAVAIEALRKQDAITANVGLARDVEKGDTSIEPPASARVALEELRAVVAGELAGASLEAPQDAAWRALVSLVWHKPAVVDVVVSVVAAQLPALVAQDPSFNSAPELVARSLGASPVERVVAGADVVSVEVARERLRAELSSALAEHAPSASWAAALSAWIGTFVRTTLSWNAAESEARRRASAASVPPVIVRAHRGEIVLRPGEIITLRHQLLARAMVVQQAEALRLGATLGTAFFVALVVVVIYLFGARRVFQRRLRTRDMVFLGLMLTLSLALLVAADALAPLMVSVYPGFQASITAFAIPVAFGPMCVRLTMPPDVSLLFALVVALLGGVFVESGMSWAVVAVLSSMTGVAFVMRGPRRFTLLLAGLGAGAVGMFAALTLELFRGTLEGRELVMLLVATQIGGLLAGILCVVVVPLVEAAFGYVTDPRLFRLADLNHPLLKDLIVHAPGTWHHSVRAAVLAESAANSVGANPLLARVMALYHDVGKISGPLSSRDQMRADDNAQGKLLPAEAAAVLREHVARGVALARHHGLPEAVAVVIEEHHADCTMEPLLEAARGRARDAGLSPGTIDEQAFRYAGRLPQTKESALVLLADQIESAACLLPGPSSARLADVVDHVVNRAMTYDTLAECDLSLKDLGRARAALKAALIDLSHTMDKR